MTQELQILPSARVFRYLNWYLAPLAVTTVNIRPSNWAFIKDSDTMSSAEGLGRVIGCDDGRVTVSVLLMPFDGRVISSEGGGVAVGGD